jgi:hypothetical protein
MAKKGISIDKVKNYYGLKVCEGADFCDWEHLEFEKCVHGEVHEHLTGCNSGCGMLSITGVKRGACRCVEVEI